MVGKWGRFQNNATNLVSPCQLSANTSNNNETHSRSYLHTDSYFSSITEGYKATHVLSNFHNIFFEEVDLYDDYSITFSRDDSIA